MSLQIYILTAYSLSYAVTDTNNITVKGFTTNSTDWLLPCMIAEVSSDLTTKSTMCELLTKLLSTKKIKK